MSALFAAMSSRRVHSRSICLFFRRCEKVLSRQYTWRICPMAVHRLFNANCECVDTEVATLVQLLCKKHFITAASRVLVPGEAQMACIDVLAAFLGSGKKSFRANALAAFVPRLSTGLSTRTVNERRQECRLYAIGMVMPASAMIIRSPYQQSTVVGGVCPFFRQSGNFLSRQWGWRIHPVSIHSLVYAICGNATQPRHDLAPADCQICQLCRFALHVTLTTLSSADRLGGSASVNAAPARRQI